MQKRKATSRTKSSKKRRNDDAITEDADKESYEVQKKQDKEQEGKERHKGQEEEFSKYEMRKLKEAEKLEEEEVSIKKESEEEEFEEEPTEEESQEERQNEAEVEVEEEPTDEESYEEQQDEVEVYSREEEEVEVEEYEDEPTEEESSEELKDEVEAYGGENEEAESEEELEIDFEEDDVEDVEQDEPEEEDPEVEQEVVRQEEVKSLETAVEVEERKKVEEVEIHEEEEVEEEEEDKMEEMSGEEEEEEQEEEEEDVEEDDEEEIGEDEEADEVGEEGEEDELGKGEEPLREPTQEEPLEISEPKNMRHACLGKDFPGEPETLTSMKMDFQKNNDAACGKKRTSRWDEKPRANGTNKTRWSNDEAQIKMHDPLHVPDLGNDVNVLSRTDPEISELTARLSDINQKLLVGELVDDPPIQKDLVSKKTGRKVSLHKQLIMEKEKIISELMKKIYVFKSSLPEIKPAKFCKKLYIPFKEYPGYKFVGLIMGPCGNSKTRMEKETGARIFVRGRGSAKEGTGKQEKDSHEDLHVLIEADSQQSLDSAVRMVEKILVPVEDVRNVHKRAQLRELAELKATMEGKNPTGVSNECSVCGDASHFTVACPLTAPNPNTHLDACQMISSVLGVGPSRFSPSCESSTPVMQRSVVSLPQSSTEKVIDECNLFVGYLPQAMNEDKLIDLFAPFGRICQARVIRDKITGLSKGYGFIKFTNKENAANAIAKINGYPIDRKKLAVRVAGSPTSASCSDTSTVKTSPSPFDLPTYRTAAMLQCTVASSDRSCPLVSMLPDANGYFINPFHHAGQPTNTTSITSSSTNLSFDRQPSVSSSPPCQLLPYVGQPPLPSIPSYECPVNSSWIANEKRLSMEFMQFPGYLNSLDLQFQKSTPTNIFESLIHHPEDKNHI